MTGTEYEQFVRAVLCRTLKLEPDKLQSTHSAGVTLPGAGNLEHQIDLFYVDETEVAEYVTIIECKYRESRPVDQALLQNLAFVRDSMRAHKAIMVSNQGFTKGARAVAESQRIALLTVEPKGEYEPTPSHSDADALFAVIQSELDRAPRNNYEVVVVCKLHDDGTGGRDLISELLADPRIREKATEMLRDPTVRDTVRVAAENPELARKAMGFLGRRRF
jgi:Restriction endonuclease